MIPRPPVHRRAIQRQLLLSSDSVWVSDEELGHVYQRFIAGARAEKRYGSAVPGPLENRRRLGKRRMGHAHHPIPAPGFGISTLWGSFGDVDRTQWRWESPTSRNHTEDSSRSASALLGWLQDWWKSRPQISPSDTTDVGDTSIRVLANAIAGVDGEEGFASEDITSLIKTIENGNRHEIRQACHRFNDLLRQNLILGIVPAQLLEQALQGITSSLHSGIPRKDMAESLCLQFYQNVWEGITRCSIFGVHEWQASTLDTLLKVLSKLPMLGDSQLLAGDIIRSISILDRQLDKNLEPNELVGRCFGMKNGLCKVVSAWVRSWTVVLRSENMTRSVFDTRLDFCKENLSSKDLVSIQCPTTADTYCKNSITALVDALKHIPPAFIPLIIKSVSEFVLTVCASQHIPISVQHEIKYYWLYLVAQLPGATDKVFVRTWREIGLVNHPTLDSCKTLILAHCVSQQSPKVRFAFSTSKRQTFRDLFIAIRNCRECYLKATGCVSNLLRGLGDEHSIHTVFSEMFEDQIIFLAKYDRMPPEKVWKILGKSVHNRSPRTIALVTKLALAFAESDSRPPRVALRNVTKCLHVLSTVGVPISSDLARAIVDSGIKQRVEAGQWVPLERLYWALDKVEQVEGTEAATVVDRAVGEWNAGIEQKARRNVLRVGPID